MKCKRIKRILLGIIGLVIVGIIVSKVNHQVKLGKEESALNAYGVGERVEVDGKKLNLYIEGAKENAATIVYMHGLGMGDTTISARPMLETLQEKLLKEQKKQYKICILDRYGNGLSDDTKQEQHVETIVDTYRKALQIKGEKGPYVLIAHSISGIYATYWAEKYPEEIQSIIYLDADPAECYVKQGKISMGMSLMSKVQEVLAFTGLQRVVMKETALVGEDENHTFTEEENKLRTYLMYRNTYSRATDSEMNLYYENAKKVLEGNVKLNIPQLYIQANRLSGSYYDTVYRERLEKSFDGKQDEIQADISEQQEQMKKKASYMTERGNIEVTQISGPHCLYEYAPQEVAEAIGIFLEQN